MSRCVCFSGFGGAEQPRGRVSGAGAAAGGACDGRGGDDPRSDVSVREAGGGEVHPGQQSSLRRHVSQLAAQRLRLVGNLRWDVSKYILRAVLKDALSIF